MGTWHKPESDREKLRLFKKLMKLRKIEIEISDLIGDDVFLDNIGLAISRLEKFCTHVTEGCEHPAFYNLMAQNRTQIRGVCKLCRCNIKNEE